jgi:hypothetical protein
MLKLVLLALEQIIGIKLADSVFKEIKSNESKELSKSLFLLYLSLNDIIINGRRIVDTIERAPSWLEGKKLGGEIDREYYTGLEFLLDEQAKAISAFVNNLLDIRPFIAVASSEADIRIEALLLGKRSVVSGLLKLLRSGKLAHDLSDTVLDQDVSILAEKRFTPSGDVYVVFEADNISRFTVDEIHSVSELMSELQLGKQLGELEEVAEKIRRGLVDNFSVDEILLNVGNPGNMKKSYNNWFSTIRR